VDARSPSRKSQISPSEATEPFLLAIQHARLRYAQRVPPTPHAHEGHVRRTQQQRREKTETALLAAAGQLIVESGVRSLTLARVGERAGYSRGIVTHHFGSKQAMLHAVAQTSQSGFVPGLADLPPGLERLLSLIEGYLNRLGADDSPGRAFLVLWAEAATDPELAVIFRGRDQQFRADLQADVIAGVKAGTIRPTVDPGDISVAILGQLRGIGMQLLFTPDVVNTARLGPMIATYWRATLAVSDDPTGTAGGAPTRARSTSANIPTDDSGSRATPRERSS
jgi:AcrR family transcriptional regulator